MNQMVENGKEIVDLVAAKRYEKALGLGYDANKAQIREAHIGLIMEYDEDSDVANALTEAKNNLTDETISEKGMRLSELGLLNDSLPYLKKAVEIQPQDWLPYNWLGATLCKLKRYEESLPYLETALRLQPNEESNNYWYGTALRYLNRTQEAIVYLKRGNAKDIPIIKPKSILQPKKYKKRKPRITNTWSDLIANTILKWPILIVAIIGTFWVILTQQNFLVATFEMIAGIICMLGMRSSIAKPRAALSDSFSLSLFALIWGGTLVSIYVILNGFEKLLLLNAFLAFTISSLASISIGVPIAKAMLRKAVDKSALVWLGFFCILFLFPFGLVNLLFPSTQQTVILLIQPMENALLNLPQLTWNVILSIPRLILSFVLLAIFTAALSNINKKIPIYKSDLRFCGTFLSGLWATMGIMELLFYVPYVGVYVGGVFGFPRVQDEPIIDHLAGFIVLSAVYLGLVASLYLIFTAFQRKAIETEISPFMKLSAISASLVISLPFVNWVFLSLGLPSPWDVGLSIFLNNLLGFK